MGYSQRKPFIADRCTPTYVFVRAGTCKVGHWSGTDSKLRWATAKEKHFGTGMRHLDTLRTAFICWSTKVGQLRCAFRYGLPEAAPHEDTNRSGRDPAGPPLHKFMMSFTDGRDSGLLLVSHFSLLTGCAVSVWLALSLQPPGASAMRGFADAATRSTRMLPGHAAVAG